MKDKNNQDNGVIDLLDNGSIIAFLTGSNACKPTPALAPAHTTIL